MKKQILQILFLFSVILFMGCRKSIVEPTPALKLADQQPFTSAKAEFYNHIPCYPNNSIDLYIDGNYKTYFSEFFGSSTNYGCGYFEERYNDRKMRQLNNLSEGSHVYQVVDLVNGEEIILVEDFFDVYNGKCTSINLFY